MFRIKNLILMTSLSILINQSGLSQQNGLTEADLTSPNIVYLDEIDELYQAGKFAEAVEKCHILIKEHPNQEVYTPEWNSTLGMEALQRLFSMFRREIRISDQLENKAVQDQFINNLEQVLNETKATILVAVATIEMGKIRLGQGNLQQAEKKFKEVVENYPSASVSRVKDQIICFSCDALDFLTDNFLIGRWNFDSAKTYLGNLAGSTPDTLLTHYARFCLAKLTDYGPVSLEEVIQKYRQVPEFWFFSPKENNLVNSREAINRALELEILFYRKEVKAKIRPQVSVVYIYPGKRPFFDLSQGESINILYSAKEKDGSVWFKVKEKEGKIGWILATDVEK